MRGMLLPGGHRLSASAFGGPESLSQASPLWVNAVGMWLGSTQSTFALPPFLVIGWDTININGFCNSILLHFEVAYSFSPSFQAGSLQSTLPTPPVLVLYPLHRCLEQLEKLTEQYVQRGHLPHFSQLISQVQWKKKHEVRTGVASVLNREHTLVAMGMLKSVLENKALGQKVSVHLSEVFVMI